MKKSLQKSEGTNPAACESAGYKPENQQETNYTKQYDRIRPAGRDTSEKPLGREYVLNRPHRASKNTRGAGVTVQAGNTEHLGFTCKDSSLNQSLKVKIRKDE